MHLPGAGFVPFGRFSLPRKPDLSFPVWPVAALMGSLVSLCVGSSFAKTLFPAMGAEGISAYRIVLATVMLMLFFRPWRRRWAGTAIPT